MVDSYISRERNKMKEAIRSAPEVIKMEKEIDRLKSERREAVANIILGWGPGKLADRLSLNASYGSEIYRISITGVEEDDAIQRTNEAFEKEIQDLIDQKNTLIHETENRFDRWVDKVYSQLIKGTNLEDIKPFKI